jgi:hypothetical protein
MNRTVVVTIQGREYPITFPTVGRQIRLESRRFELSGGFYVDMSRSMGVETFNALEQVDAISFFEVMCPEVFREMKVSSPMDIDAIDALELVGEYRNKVRPWYNTWLKRFKETYDTYVKLEDKENKKQGE